MYGWINNFCNNCKWSKPHGYAQNDRYEIPPFLGMETRYLKCTWKDTFPWKTSEIIKRWREKSIKSCETVVYSMIFRLNIPPQNVRQKTVIKFISNSKTPKQMIKIQKTLHSFKHEIAVYIFEAAICDNFFCSFKNIIALIKP
jgi:hypothetical protein